MKLQKKLFSFTYVPLLNVPHVFYFVFISFLVQACNTGNEDKEISEIIQKINAKCPAFIDSETQLDGIDLKDGKALTYKYTLIHATAAAIDTQQFRLSMYPGILSTIRISPEMKKLRESKFHIYYQYKDGYGKPIYTFHFDPKSYE